MVRATDGNSLGDAVSHSFGDPSAAVVGDAVPMSDAVDVAVAVTDPWSTVLPGPSPVPAYLVTQYAAQYRVVVDVLLEAQDTTLTGRSVQEIEEAVEARLVDAVGHRRAAELLADAVFNLEARLGQLEKWDVLTRWQEPARTGEDFLRRRDRFQLTPLAARLHAFWLAAEGAGAGGESDDAASGDVTLAPRAIFDRLTAFSVAVQQAAYGPAAGEFQQVIALHEAMARAARSWQRTLAHALSGGPDPAKQDAVWATLQAYVAMWGEQVDVHSPRIREVILGCEPTLDEATMRACVRAALADASPDELVAAQVLRWQRTWQALRTWFVDGSGGGQARRLRRQLRDVVAPWARNMHLLMDTGGAVTRRAEMIQLAAAVERAEDDDQARRIWDTAVGAFAARHLLVAAPDSALGGGAGQGETAVPSWWDADPAPVTTRFRAQGPRSVVGRRPRMSDFRTGREAARQARAAASAARSSAEASLRQRSGSRFSDWGPLGDAELDLLLDLVGAARRASSDGRSDGQGDGRRDGGGAPVGTLVATSGDGRWRVSLTAPDSPGRTARLRSPSGDLVATDWWFVLEPA